MIEIDLTGQVLKSRYCILEQIGKGGNAKVYLARDLELGILRAVKELPVTGKREARFLASLEHPSLPQMIDYEENSRNCYIIMEYIKGQTLGELLRQGRTFTGKELAEFGEVLSQVLGYLHSRKPPVFYGDLKPDNIMLSESGKLYLIDLGSAVAGYEKVRQSCMGTEGFAAPEQYEGRVGITSDVFCLGRTLEALSGKSLVQRVLTFPGLAFVLIRCCIHEEKLRYQKMELLEKRFQRLKKRPAGMAGWIGAGVLVVVLLLSGLWMMGNRENTEMQKSPDFYELLTEATEIYHTAYAQGMSEEEKERACRNAEKKLLEMRKSYRRQKEYRQIMMHLAKNREFAGRPEEAALYYEEMLRHDGGFREVYGEYGRFLLRMGQKDGCRELWLDYTERAADDGLEDGMSRNLILWEEEMKDISRNEKSKNRKKKENRERKKESNRE